MAAEEILKQFPLIALIVVLFGLVFGGIGVGIQWVWAEVKKVQEADRAWRAEQNRLRETAVAEQNALWRTAMEERDRRYEKFDQDRQGTIVNLTEMIEKIAVMLQSHDEQAKDIKRTVESIQHEVTQPIPRGRK